MKTVVMATTAVFVASAAMASLAEIDTDGDGVVSFTEMSATYPTITEDGFSAVDTNGDGVVDAEEMDAAVAGGLLPATSG